MISLTKLVTLLYHTAILSTEMHTTSRNHVGAKSGMNKLKINDHNLVDTVSQRVRLHKRVFCHLSMCHCQKY